MALFNNGISEEKAQKLLQRYGLTNVDPQYADALQKIATHLAGSGFSEFGGILSNDDRAVNRAQTQYIHAILEQNFIIIRELDQLIYLLERR